MRRAVSPAIFSSGQSGCRLATPARTSRVADLHMLSSVASLAADASRRSTAISAGSHRS